MDTCREGWEPPLVKEEGKSPDGTNEPGPPYCLLLTGLGVTFFSGGGACRNHVSLATLDNGLLWTDI